MFQIFFALFWALTPHNSTNAVQTNTNTYSVQSTDTDTDHTAGDIGHIPPTRPHK